MWQAKLNASLDQQIDAVETTLLKEFNQQPVARELLKLLSQRYPTTSHYILPPTEIEAVDWSFTTTPPAYNWINADYDQTTWSSCQGDSGRSALRN